VTGKGRGAKKRIVMQKYGVIPNRPEEVELLIAFNGEQKYVGTALEQVGIFTRGMAGVSQGLGYLKDQLITLCRLVPRGQLHNTLTTQLQTVQEMKASCLSVNVLTGDIGEPFLHFTQRSDEEVPKKRRKLVSPGGTEELDAFRLQENQCLCGLQFPDEEEYNQHQMAHTQYYDCCVCQQRFTKGRSCFTHYLKHEGLFRFKCDYKDPKTGEACDWQGANEYGTLVGHQIRKHGYDRPAKWPYKCTVEGCTTFIEHERWVKPHILKCKQRKGDKQKCPGCSRKFTTRDALLKHFACNHDGPTFDGKKFLYRCPHKDCQEYAHGFTAQPTFKDHVVVKHGNKYWEDRCKKFKVLFKLDKPETEKRLDECHEYMNLKGATGGDGEPGDGDGQPGDGDGQPGEGGDPPNPDDDPAGDDD